MAIDHECRICGNPVNDQGQHEYPAGVTPLPTIIPNGHSATAHANTPHPNTWVPTCNRCTRDQGPNAPAGKRRGANITKHTRQG